MLLKVTLIGLAIYLSIVLAVAALLQHTGVLVVRVQDKVKQKSVFVPVPMMMVNGAIGLIPDTKLNSARDRLRNDEIRWVMAVSDGLARCPDANFVEVKTPTDQVLIAKRGSNLLLDVDTPEKRVYVSVPLHAVRQTVKNIVSN
jgi:hypothetical protein